MNVFDYVRPETIGDAVSASAKPGAAYLAGGTNLLDLMKVGVRAPATLVDITRIPDLREITALDDGDWRIGALVPNADLARHEGFAKAFPAAAEALLSGASPQLRNAATLGGNLMQQTRCPYFYDTASACNRREPGSGCDALDGETSKHAILGWTMTCMATHPSDLCAALMALDAVIEIEGPTGKRDIAIDSFYALPDETNAGGAELSPGELITGIRLPASGRDFACHARYLKVRDRTSYAFALVSAAAMLDVQDGTIKDVRIALGGVAAKPWRAREAEAQLKGKAATGDAFDAAAETALSGATPSGDNAYKITLAKRLVKKALNAALSGTPDRMPALPGSVFSTRKERA
ncbi:MAG: xanthine dehydrogenase family protein subunit M [Henriciella sp.]|uniref:FAD binding domain-containing protein n=1 Tax=Henriciella sp. TaxID=1968823 RepID=UPI003C719A7A